MSHSVPATSVPEGTVIGVEEYAVGNNDDHFAVGRRCRHLRADLAVLNEELAAWASATNADERQVDWRFTASDARIKLRHLYPALERRRPTSRY